VKAILILVIVASTTATDEPLDRAGFNRVTWEAVLTDFSGIESDRATYLLERLPLVDVLELDAETVRNHVTFCTRALRFHPFHNPPEDTIRSWILWPRAGHWEFVTDWRPTLETQFRNLVSDNPAETARNVVEEIRRSVSADDRRDLFGPPSPPLATYRRGWGTKRELATLIVAGLRSVGLAARVVQEGTGVEYWEKGRWHLVHTADQTGIAASEISAAADAVLTMNLTKDSEPFLSEEAIGLARWEEGKWKPILPPEVPLHFERTDSTMTIRTVPGQYLLTAGVRNANGEPRIWFKEVELISDSIVGITQDLTVPFDRLRRADLVDGKEPVIETILLETPEGVSASLDSMIRGQSAVLCVLQRGSEPSERLLKGVREALASDRIGQSTVFLPICLMDCTVDDWLTDHAGTLRSALGLPPDNAEAVKMLPTVLVYAQDGSMLLRKSGYNSRIPELVGDVLFQEQVERRHHVDSSRE
jgi:hypothetical protein